MLEFEGFQRVPKVPNGALRKSFGNFETLWKLSKFHTNALIRLVAFYSVCKLLFKKEIGVDGYYRWLYLWEGV